MGVRTPHRMCIRCREYQTRSNEQVCHRCRDAPQVVAETPDRFRISGVVPHLTRQQAIFLAQQLVDALSATDPIK